MTNNTTPSFFQTNFQNQDKRSITLSIIHVALITALILFVLVIAGCSSKSSSLGDGSLSSMKNGGLGQEDLLGGSGAGGKYGNFGAGSLNEGNLNADLNRRYGDGSIPIAEGEGMFRDIRFGFDSASVSAGSIGDVQYNAEVLRANPDVKVQLEGHCDERGTNDYNLALGQRRAQSVMDLLISYGISRDRLETISYGSEVPLDPSSNESAWAKNRRAHFTPYREN